MNLDLGFEVLGIDLVEPAEECVAGTGNQDFDIAELRGGASDEFPN